MAAISPEQLATLITVLERDYVPHLPPIIEPSGVADENIKKNRSRAFSAFAVNSLCASSPQECSRDVIDNKDDEGIDSIHFSQSDATLYLAQGKLKEGKKFHREDALAFCHGVQKLIVQDFSHFNQTVQDRLTDIEGALDECRRIQLVVAHIGEGISEDATRVINKCLANEIAIDGRLVGSFIDFDGTKTEVALRQGNAVRPISATLNLAGWSEIDVPNRTFYGVVQLSVLAELHNEFGDDLFNKNIRLFLGQDTDVNSSILSTLAAACPKFFYLNNGVTLLCNEIVPKANKGTSKRLQLNGVSVINGAQTIATAAQYLSNNQGADISEAKVLFTVIEIPGEDDFGDDVTKARNHQNAVSIADFAALDTEQERLRRDIASLGISYTYKDVGTNRNPGPTQLYIEEASQALALISTNPINTAYLKDRPTDFLDVTKPQYKEIFAPSVTAYQTVNAVKVGRYVLGRISSQADAANGAERLTYRNGNYLLAWLLTRHCGASISEARILDEAILPDKLGQPLDDLRQILMEETSKVIGSNSHSSFFKNQTQVKNLAKLIMVRHFGIVVDDGMLRREQADPDKYVEYLASLAPQIDLHG